MAVIFDLISLKGHEKKIDKLLTFKEKNSFSKFSNFSSTNTKTVKMYITDNKKVNIPYRFACVYFNKFYNQDKEYPFIFENKEGKFSGKLLPRQEEPYEQAIKYLYKYKTVTIALYPGFGKTFLGCMLSWYINKKTCILVHRENVGKQWVKTFKNYLPLNDEDIWFVDDKYKKNAKILICMNGRVKKIPKEEREKVGCLIIDEAHCFCSESNVKPLLSFTPKYIIAETATPKKDNNMHKMIESMCGTHYIQKLSTKKFKLIVIQTNLDFPIEEENNIFGELLKKRASSTELNEIILNILSSNQDYKTIVACARKSNCSFLHSELEKKGLKSAELYGTKKNYKTENILIGTGSKMGVGFDEANFCDDFDGRPSDLLIITYTFASWSPYEQVRGRGMRTENPVVIIFNDNSNITKNHIRKMIKWSKESKGDIYKINVDDIEDYKLSSLIKKK
jgi:hypothetical protein